MSNNHIILMGEYGDIQKKLDGSKYYIRSKYQDELVKMKEKSKGEFEEFNERTGKFIWSYPEKIQQLIKSNEFTKSDITMIFYLATFINGTGYLAYENRVKLNKKGIQNKLEIGRTLFGKFFNKLIKFEILIPSGDYFKWNETYNFYGSTKGKAKPKTLVRTYVNQIRELYEAKNEKGKRKYSAINLYPIFALVPYLHHSSNIVCKNPNVQDIEDIEYFNLKEIAELLDLRDSKRMAASLHSLLLDGQTTFIKVESKNEAYLKLNPRIFWRGTNIPDKNLIAEFDMLDKNRKNK
ncbi:hypothetical protein [Priestia megaterium]|uniref:hypothetical protein n=2 Tax=Priestia megaterium TaxID=1404 RepID=UPI000BF3673E|nr:hypothetical protein [Priestia megaterium]PFQ79732.1 hypothetical protein COK11_20940 [Priestia megaterium]